MHEMNAYDPGSGLTGIAHAVVVICPNDSDEEIADRITEPCRPERQERFKGGEFGRAQLQNQHRYKDSEHAVRKRVQSFRGPSDVRPAVTPFLHSHRFDVLPKPLRIRPSTITSPRPPLCEPS